MNNCVTLLHRDRPGVAERNLKKIVEFMGGTVRPVELVGEASRQAQILRDIIPAGGCVLASADSISGELHAMLLELNAHVLVYGFDVSEPSAKTLRLLLGSSASVVEIQRARRINVADQREVCSQMTGQSFDAEAQLPFAFNGGNTAPLLSSGQMPFFIRSNEASRWMLLAQLEIADFDAIVSKGNSVLNFVPGLVPVMMFLRNAAPKAFWHNDSPTACFIVDDPLLRSRYGFLDYSKLLELVDRKQFSVSVAFIPWNYRRSQRRVVEMFASRPGACSLSVHGCDHTRGEFNSADVPSLAEKSRLALDRMTTHRELTGLEFDKVMVFPQGLFSGAAVPVLKSCGYLAAVNSTPYPTDGEQSLALRDLLGIAVSKFAGFPLFTRRYPQHIAELAFDLFLGKPAFIVEHHSYFQNGYEALAETVERVGRLDERLRWMSLADACSHACLKRYDANGETHVLFATSRFEFRNDSDHEQRMVLMQNLAVPSAVKSVEINGANVAFEKVPDGFKLRLTLAARKSARVKVESAPFAPALERRTASRAHQFKVFLRRNLCEFRDNYVATSRIFGKQTAVF